MRRVVLVALAACGRVNFDPQDDIGYFVSPNGNDANPGTRALPWLSVEQAMPRLVPGDRLTLLDGDYDAKGATGRTRIHCAEAGMVGTADAPIVVRADRPRKARVFGNTNPLEVRFCSYWQFDDIFFDGADEATDNGAIGTISDSDHITVRGALFAHANRSDNNSAVEVSRSQFVTIEKSEAYDFHRVGFVDFLSHDTVFDQLYANGRDRIDLPVYMSQCAGGDVGFESYYAHGTKITRSISENACSRGFSIVAGSDGALGYGDNHELADDIALGDGLGTNGFMIESDCDATNSCANEDRVAEANSIRNSVAIEFYRGFFLLGRNNTIENVTSFPTTTGIEMDKYGGTLAASAIVRQALVLGSTTGIRSANQTSWSVIASNVWSAATPYSPNDANVQQSTTVNPQIDYCSVYLPATSPMRTAGPNGTPIGADIRTIWNADGSFIGCGAIVAGVNDDPATSCRGVHTRLQVNTANCPLP